MGHPKRIPVDAIQAMKKILDALPDKNIGKTQEEALAMLGSHIRKAYSKGYSAKELAAIMTNGKVGVSAPTLRAHTCPPSTRTRKANRKSDISAPPKQEERTRMDTGKPMETKVEVTSQQARTPGSIVIKPDTPRDEL